MPVFDGAGPRTSAGGGLVGGAGLELATPLPPPPAFCSMCEQGDSSAAQYSAGQNSAVVQAIDERRETLSSSNKERLSLLLSLGRERLTRMKLYCHLHSKGRITKFNLFNVRFHLKPGSLILTMYLFTGELNVEANLLKVKYAIFCPTLSLHSPLSL